MNFELQAFLNQCQKSSADSYRAFMTLLEALQQTDTQRSARQFLSILKEQCQGDLTEKFHFQFIQQDILDHFDQTRTLELLQFPSTFLPEDWSFTFYEGLVRYPETEYKDKKLVELGCGIGWISLALAIRYLPEKMVGLDINPKAISCSKLNLYLNGLNDEGDLVLLDNQVSLLDILSYQESDLLNVFVDKPHYFDKIIGCIPQVLNPEPEVMETLIADSSTDEYLHSLSNYTAFQGYVEDQFGLGLIARAVEQSIALLKPNGKLILNLGGRPGRSVLERLMQRRGFAVRRIWQTQVEQAADTDIDALVEIEKHTDHRFEFYMSKNGGATIDARTAHALAGAGGQIFHSVDVYEAKMFIPDDTKVIYETIHQLDCDRLKSAVDLTYDRLEDAEERYKFLSTLTQWLQKIESLPYEETAGLVKFRLQVAEYFNYYHRVSVNENQVLISPGRSDLLNNLLVSYQPHLTLVAKPLKPLISRRELNSLELLEVPTRIELQLQLIKALQPQCLITQLDADQIQSRHLVEQLIQVCHDHQTLLVLDISQWMELSSHPETNGLYTYLSEKGLSENLMIIAELINNKVYRDYSLNIVLTNNQHIYRNLLDAAELTYSRTAVLTQIYYANLLEELLYFQRTRQVKKTNTNNFMPSSCTVMRLSPQAEQAFKSPALVGNHLQFNPQSIRLDFGENELVAPAILKEVLLESFLVRHFPADEASPEQVIADMLQQRFGFKKSTYAQMLFSEGVAPLFAALLKLCALEEQTLLMPTGCYGYFRAAAQFHNVKVEMIETDETFDFKLQPEQIEKAMKTHPKAWLFLNAPVVNPTGALYSQQELDDLLSVAAAQQCTVIMDSIFSGLEFDHSGYWELDHLVQKFVYSTQARLVLISGVAKEYAAGGLRFGYAWSANRELMQSLQSLKHRKIHYTLGYAARELFQAHVQQEPRLVQHLQTQKALLAERAKRLTEILQAKGWQVLKPSGGLFLVAKPQKYIEENQLDATKGADQMVAFLFEQQNLAVNNSTWTGLPGYCRFVLSVSEQSFNEALLRLQMLTD